MGVASEPGYSVTPMALAQKRTTTKFPSWLSPVRTRSPAPVNTLQNAGFQRGCPATFPRLGHYRATTRQKCAAGVVAAVAVAVIASPTAPATAHTIDPSVVCRGVWAHANTVYDGRRAYRHCARIVQRHNRRHCGPHASPRRAIQCVWPANTVAAATRVAMCESGLDPTAANGQYLGIFQMGAQERDNYGHGPAPITQARAAHRYWRAAGWVPWSCKP